ncbi:GspH/FimT family pseudopilin [Roseateles violae]|uniref:Type II secretion system protein H n=1 Tax=Roseateles violae TaxID=3058042 RepID=A0ABT8DQD0_9BURK|nr:GspH/FimT family pseudopilin [Pelomonas sp. PFR6]MDN3920561.1 GspH/FimT family pseudopilin [Pelomonas sp. PFR6]
MNQPQSSRRQQAGFSLVELGVTMAISAIVCGGALPSLGRIKEQQQLRLLAQTVMVDLQQARSEAVLSGAGVQLRFSQHPGGSCYLLHKGGQCRCDDSGQPVCTGAAQVLKQEWIPASRRLTVRANVQTMSFQARQGTVTSTGSIDVAGSGGTTIRHVVSIAGRVRSCTPTGGVSGLPRC